MTQPLVLNVGKIERIAVGQFLPSQSNLGFRFGSTDTDSLIFVLDKTFTFDKITAIATSLVGIPVVATAGTTIVFTLRSQTGTLKGSTIPLVLSTASTVAVSASITGIVGLVTDVVVITISGAAGANKQVSVNLEGVI